MNETKKILIAVSVLTLASIVAGVAFACAYQASTQAASLTGQYSYGNPYVQPAPSNAYGSFGAQTPFNSGYGYYGGMGGMGRMGMMR